MKRKRTHDAQEEDGCKRVRADLRQQQHEAGIVYHPVLARVGYARVCTLRSYLLSRVADCPKKRRRALARLGGDGSDGGLCWLLDNVVIGSFRAPNEHETRQRSRGFHDFIHAQGAAAAKEQIVRTAAEDRQAQIVNYVVQRLPSRAGTSIAPAHLLCHDDGAEARHTHGGDVVAVLQEIDGGGAAPSSYADMLKGQPWPLLLAHLGRNAERVMIDLLLDCGIFTPVGGASNSYRQISGTPVSRLYFERRTGASPAGPAARPRAKDADVRQPSSIRFVRSRMLYGRATLNQRGDAQAGLKRIHVLNRCPDHADVEQTKHLSKYVFPRQSGLHNVFTSAVDWRETAQPFKDYSLRESEIEARTRRATADGRPERLPRRLRGPCLDMIRGLQRGHGGCPYAELLRRHCPDPTGPWADGEQREGAAVGEHANSWAQVSAFARAVMRRLLPDAFFGAPGAAQASQNRRRLDSFVDRMVRMRRAESLTLHDLLQGFQIAAVPWLRPPNVPEGSRLAHSDSRLRRELLAEALYFAIDGILIPLLQANFYVTESSTDRNRLLFFRHDAWRRLTEPALREIRSGMFEEVAASPKRNRVASAPTPRLPGADRGTQHATFPSSLGHSDVRLLPKGSTFRLITNLRRRTPTWRGGRLTLGPSINARLRPGFEVLDFEKSSVPGRLGTSLQSVHDIPSRLAAYRKRLELGGWRRGDALWFAKVDISRCFDSIPQQAALRLVDSLLTSHRYSVAQIAELHAAEAALVQVRNVSRCAPSAARKTEGEGSEAPWRNTVCHPRAAARTETRSSILRLLRRHLTQNTVRMGGKTYRQSRGVPQGSCVSTLLCNLFYASFENARLGWLVGRDDTCLMRLVDDFLVVSKDQGAVRRFVEQMHAGDADYGVEVRTTKTAANFDLGAAIRDGARCVPEMFEYCGLFIDTRDMNVHKTSRYALRGFHDTLTVEHSRNPGRTFRRKALNAFKIQMHTRLLDGTVNSLQTAAANLHQAFAGAANRCYAYLANLPLSRRPGDDLLCGTIDDLVRLARRTMRSRGRRTCGAACGIKDRWMRWLAFNAFTSVFQRRQTGHAGLLAWLARETSLCDAKLSASQRRLLVRAAEC